MLYLYNDFRTIQQSRAVGLPDGSGGDGDLIESAKNFLRQLAEFFHDSLLYFRVRPGRQSIL